MNISATYLISNFSALGDENILENVHVLYFKIFEIFTGNEKVNFLGGRKFSKSNFEFSKFSYQHKRYSKNQSTHDFDTYRLAFESLDIILRDEIAFK